MSTRGSRLEARNQRDVVAFEGRVKAWEKRWVEGETREGHEKNKTTFYRWIPAVDERGVDVVSTARGREGCPYECVGEEEKKS